MEVILLEQVEKLGNIGQIVNVKSGYARNYLIPQEKALRASDDNKAIFEQKKAELEKKNKEKIAEAEKVAAKLKEKFFVVIRQAGEDGRLYGSVTARDVATAIADAGVEIDRKDIHLNEGIKFIGVYPIIAKPHPEVSVELYANIARSTDDAKDAQKEFLNPSKPKEEAAPAEEVKADKKEAEAEDKAGEAEEVKAEAKSDEEKKA